MIKACVNWLKKVYAWSRLAPLLLLFSLFTACNPDEIKPTDNSISFEPDASTPINQDLINEMEYFINSGKYGPIESIMVFKDNKCVFEKYYNGATQDMLVPLYTATPFITSGLMGIAIDKGLIKTQDEPVLNFFQDIPDISDKSDKEKIHLHHLLSQSAGINSGVAWRDLDTAYAAILNSDMNSNPGEEYSNDAGMAFLMGKIMKKACAIPVDSFASEYLFKPLDITNWLWEKDSLGRVYTDGFSKGLWLNTRDFAKIGLLYMNNGAWGTKQLISNYWVNETFKPWMYMSYEYHQGYYCRVMNPSTTTPRLYNTSVVNINGSSQNIWIMKEINTMILITADKNASKDKLPEFLTHYLLPALFPDRTLEFNPSYNYTAHIIDSIEIDGDLSEWDGFDKLIPQNPIQTRNKISYSDYYPEIKIAWSRFRPTKIFIAAEIIDDVCIENQAINDHLDISLDLLNKGRTFQWIFNTNGTFYGDVANASNTTFKVKKLDDRYYFEIAIDVWEGNPVEYDLKNFFIEPGTYIGLKINCTDVDDFADLGTVLGWSTDDEQDFLFNDYTRPALYGSVLFTNK